MPSRDQEDFELVLGNKQLLSLFFFGSSPKSVKLAMEICVSEAAKRPTPDTMPVAQLAAGCFILMDADKGNR